ncbi:MAG TPA: hypothetical protein VL981_10900 [Candidatus Methylacidiphilales bacterium]|nr:hypothetical protein [Candidatus Methylacidiphilales bacterium]
MNEPKPDREAQLDALFARARTHRADTSAAEYAFETRLLARLREKPQPDLMSIWAKVSWRLSPLFAACMVGIAIWHSQVTAAANEAAEAASVAEFDNPSVDDWTGVD